MQSLLFMPSAVTKDSFKEVEGDSRLVKANQLDYCLNWLRDAPELFIDYETTGNDPKKGAQTFCLGAYTPDKGPRVLDFRYLGDAGRRCVIDGLSARKPTQKTVAFNIAFEDMMSESMGFQLGGTPWDPCLAAFALNETREPYGEFGPHTQKALCFHELKIIPKFANAIKAWLLANTGQSESHYELLPPSLLVPYSCEDIELGWKLHKHLEAQVDRNNQRKLVQTDSYLGPIVSRIESRGIAFDKDRALQLLEEISSRKRAAQSDLLQALDGRAIDVLKDGALFGLLYGDFKLPMHGDQEKKGALDQEVLNWMLDLPEVKADPRKTVVIDKTLDLRELDKMQGTYLLPWTYEFLDVDVIHPHLSMMGPRTRRFSANSPNMQNVPTRSELGKMVRSVFMSRKGWTTYSMDESQAEYRSFAHYAMAKALIEAYVKDPRVDFHQVVSDMMGVPRKDGKNLNFACLYGIGVEKLARDLRRSVEAAKAIRNRYFNMFPDIRRHRYELEQQVKNFGYIKDEFGGRRHITPQQAHIALNTENQMTVADLIREAMVRANPIIKRAGGNMLLQVHDEILFELPGDSPAEREDHKPILRLVRDEAMENYPQFRVPFRSDCMMWSPDWSHEEEVKLAA